MKKVVASATGKSFSVAAEKTVTGVRTQVERTLSIQNKKIWAFTLQVDNEILTAYNLYLHKHEPLHLPSENNAAGRKTVKLA